MTQTSLPSDFGLSLANGIAGVRQRWEEREIGVFPVPTPTVSQFLLVNCLLQMQVSGLHKQVPIPSSLGEGGSSPMPTVVPLCPVEASIPNSLLQKCPLSSSHSLLTCGVWTHTWCLCIIRGRLSVLTSHFFTVCRSCPLSGKNKNWCR